MRLLPIGQFGVGVYNIDGSFFAIANHCSHEGAPLCLGSVGGTNEFDATEPGSLRRVREGRIVRCPWHMWEFDITTGRTWSTRANGSAGNAADLYGLSVSPTG